MLRYAHTNLIARDARALVDFYKSVLGCESVGQTRDLSGDWLDRLTNIPGAHIVGEHLALPGCGGNITLEIFQYGKEGPASAHGIDVPGFQHIAFEVDDVAETLAAVRARGGGQLGELVTADYPDGRRATFVYATDPEGNILELQSWKRENPWKKIDLDEYESHMGLASVGQLQAISRMTAGQLARYPVKTVAILGVAGGNGLEHVDPEKFAAVYGIDVNPAYLAECGRRFPRLAHVLRLIEADAGDPGAHLPRAELVIANLFVEYIGCAAFARAAGKMGARYVSCGVQVDAGEGFVSDSPYAHIFDGLSAIHASVDEESLCDCLGGAGYDLILREAEPLPNGKALARLDFARRAEAE